MTPDARAAHATLIELGLDVGELLDWETAPLMFTFCDFDGNRLDCAEPVRADQRAAISPAASRSTAICADRFAIAMNMASPRSVRPTIIDANTAMRSDAYDERR